MIARANVLNVVKDGYYLSKHVGQNTDEVLKFEVANKK